MVALWNLTVKGDLLGKLWLLPGLIAQGNWNSAQKVVADAVAARGARFAGRWRRECKRNVSGTMVNK
ncbi:MAG: hypothetical protein A2Z03_08330 [Chloroflexi bacterium RBG_16_56_8]|nr:MAG: hypothetical protein A2Z03_08330 [Chloroflexi bacterium RBG_16_56_8]